MDLSGLLALIDEMAPYRELLGKLGTARGTQRVAVLDAARPYLLACLFRRLGVPVLVLTARQERARWLREEIGHWLGSGSPMRLFPEPDALPYERLRSDAYTVQQRLKVLSDLSRGSESSLVIASAYAAAQKTVPAHDFVSSCETIQTGLKLDLDRVLAGWLEIGYVMQSTVDLPGTMSRRGGIIDIYSPGGDLPARIELLGDSVESIRLFDPADQRSVDFVDRFVVIPARESHVPLAWIEAGLHGLDLSSADGAAVEAVGRLGAEHRTEGTEQYSMPAKNGAFLDYFPEHTLVVLDEPGGIETALAELDAQAVELAEAHRQRGDLSAETPSPYFTWTELVGRAEGFGSRLALAQWAGGEEACQMAFSQAPAHGGNLSTFLEETGDIVKNNARLVIVSQQAERLSELLDEHDIVASPVSDVLLLPPSGSLTLVRGSLAGGWTADAGALATVLSDAEVFGFSKKRRAPPRRFARSEDVLAELSPGDYVVHVDHGIARFSGLTTLRFDGSERAYLILEYAAGDRLYVPSDQIDRVGRYVGPGGYTPSLTRLGTQEWKRAKQRVKEAAGNLARELLALYSTRQVAAGFAFSADTAWQQELEASFAYEETADQLKAVQEVKRDMERSRPMDRLVCGDVGYGKTEVAVRAAFKAVQDGMQVAVLVPTTVLAQQHVTTFRERLGAFPVRVECLSRFLSPREQRQVVEGLSSGSVDICIGTHRLLQKDVSFRNLGLVLIDEEQRFGVSHKERLKQLRREVDVLTLSATPIPRTLHMSLIGVRDMSTMETPPEERLPIKSRVAAYNDGLVREAVLRELERDGQVFYVHNRVQRIGWVARKLEGLVPEARIGVAHGQMPEEMLEAVMLDFAEGRIDVLVCTTIIESGLDLPNVNTLIVDDADRLGLTQLYQLRGRVGRGANRAYAYFLYAAGKELTEAARKRLRTIFEASELGAGFRIAMKDLEIRGAGNILGPEQSGHMGAVGFELYTRMLSEAVSELAAGPQEVVGPETDKTTVDLPLTAHIPEEYVADLDTRLALYMRLAKVGSLQDVDGLEADLRDRFGPLLPEVKDLLYMVRVKLMAGSAGIQDISTQGELVVMRINPASGLDRSSIQAAFDAFLKVGRGQIRLDIKRAGREWKSKLTAVLERIAQAVTEDRVGFPAAPRSGDSL